MGLPLINNTLEKVKSLTSGLFHRKIVEPEGPQTVLACDLGHSKISFVEVEKTPEKLKIIRFHKVARPEKLAEGLKECVEKAGFSTHNVRVSIKGQGVIVRFIQFPKMGASELKGALSYEAEKYIPFKANEVVIDFAILDENVEGSEDPQMNLLLVAVKRDEIYSLIQTYQDSGLMVNLIDIDAIAYGNALEFFHPETKDETVAILDVGTEISTVSVIQKGKPRFIRDISYGSVDIIKRLKRKLGVSDEDAVKMLESQEKPDAQNEEVIKEGAEQLITDLKVSLDYYSDQTGASGSISKLFVGGGAGNHALLRQALSEDLEFPVQLMDIQSKVEIGEDVSKEEIEKYWGMIPVALGLALRDV